MAFGQSFLVTTTFSPPYVNGYAGLAVGETGTYTATASTVQAGGLTTGPTSQTIVVKFIGKETITVPAGTFNACRHDYFAADGSVSSRAWTYRSTLLKSVPTAANSTILQLKLATINGAPI